MLEWRIYYANHTTFDNTQGSPAAAPPYGVIVINELDPKTNIMRLHGWDYYYWHSTFNQWWGSNLIGMIDQFTAFPTLISCLKVGRNVGNVVFDEIMKIATSDKDFFPRSAGRQKLENPEP